MWCRQKARNTCPWFISRVVIVVDALCWFKLLFHSIAGVALVVYVTEQLCRTWNTDEDRGSSAALALSLLQLVGLDFLFHNIAGVALVVSVMEQFCRT